MADLARHDLVDRDPGADVRRALVQADAGQERAVASSVVARAVGPALGRLVVEAAEDLDVALERFQGLQGALELEIGPLPSGHQEAGIAPLGK